jgi:hypothetical protein
MPPPVYGTEDMEMITKILLGLFVIMILGMNLLGYAVYFMGLPNCGSTRGFITLPSYV